MPLILTPTYLELGLAVRLEVVHTPLYPDFATWATVATCSLDSTKDERYNEANGLDSDGMVFRACKTDAQGRVRMELVPNWGSEVMAEALQGAGWGEYATPFFT